MSKEEIVKQTKLAFDFVRRLYLETSYFIKEVEGILQQEEEEFEILRPSGYGITTFRSIGLESGVEDWCIRKGTVFFVAKQNTELSRGQTITRFKPELRVVLLRFVLHDKDLAEPEICAGVISDIVQKVDTPKFEAHAWKFAYHDKRILRDSGESTYEDGEISFRLNLMKKPLYDMSNAEDIQKQIVDPVLAIYRQ